MPMPASARLVLACVCDVQELFVFLKTTYCVPLCESGVLSPMIIQHEGVCMRVERIKHVVY